MKKGLNFTKEELIDLYHNQRLSLNKIAEKYRCNGTNILYWLKKFDILRRPSNYRKTIIPAKVLADLYWSKNMSSVEIGRKFGINGRSVRKKLKKFGIPRKTVSQALTKKFKAEFTGDLSEKAYFLGLRSGDFHARRMKKSIRVQTTTTHQAQVELLRAAFREYGELRKYLSKNVRRGDEWFIYVDLCSSFEFLLKKPGELPEWVLNDKNCFYSFLAAYMDCEGSWKVIKRHKNCKRFVFCLRTGDLEILNNILERLKMLGFNPRFYLDTVKGDTAPYGKLILIFIVLPYIEWMKFLNCLRSF